MSDSVRPHRRQPTRLPRPWDSPAKNTGVGCHFLLQFRKVKSESEVTQSCPTLRDPMDCSLPGSSVHGIFQARILEWVAIAFSNNNLRERWRLSEVSSEKLWHLELSHPFKILSRKDSTTWVKIQCHLGTLLLQSMQLLLLFSHIWPFATPWTEARQAPLFMGFSRQEYWSGLPFPSPIYYNNIQLIYFNILKQIASFLN